MKLKTLYVILAVLAVGVLAVILLDDDQANTSSAGGYSLPAINSKDVEVIKIKTAADNFEITRDSAGWTVGGKKADSSKVDDFLSSLSEVEIKGPVGTSEENYGRFSVDEASGTEVTILASQNKELLHLVIGKTGSDYSSTYFKPYDGKNVYTASGAWSTSVYKTVSDWRDKTIWSFATGEVKKIIAEQSGKTYEASLEGEEWSIKYFGTTKIAESLASEFASMKAVGFTIDEMVMNDSLTFYGEDNAEILSYDVGADDSFYYLAYGSIEEKFKISKSTFEQFWLPTVFDTAE